MNIFWVRDVFSLKIIDCFLVDYIKGCFSLGGFVYVRLEGLRVDKWGICKIGCSF